MTEIRTTLTQDWNEEFSKLDKLGVITYFTLLISYILLLIYYAYFNEQMIEILRLTYPNGNFTILNFIAFISISAGMVFLSMTYCRIVEIIFYPENKEEKNIKKKFKKFKRKYPLTLAIMKKRELELNLKLKELNLDINDWNLK